MLEMVSLCESFLSSGDASEACSTLHSRSQRLFGGPHKQLVCYVASLDLSVLPGVTFQVNYLKSLSQQMFWGNTLRNTSSNFSKVAELECEPRFEF